jgi:hypothetical protein
MDTLHAATRGITVCKKLAYLELHITIDRLASNSKWIFFVGVASVTQAQFSTYHMIISQHTT